MLYEERQRISALEQREAAGDSVWTDELSDPVRRKLWYAVENACDSYHREKVLSDVRSVTCQVLGLAYLNSPHNKHPFDVEQAVLAERDGLVLSVVEALYWAFSFDPNYQSSDPSGFERRVNEVFRSHRVSYELVEGKIVPFDSQEMHAEVVAPSLRLLSGRDGWEAVEKAYQGALKEIGDDPSDAITDAGTALQEALTLRGCEGNALGPLLRDAKRKGVLAPHDPTLGGAIGKIVDWVSADRSEKGDGHKSVTGATPEDAWLAVHVVGALILRLARGDDRS